MPQRTFLEQVLKVAQPRFSHKSSLPEFAGCRIEHKPLRRFAEVAAVDVGAVGAVAAGDGFARVASGQVAAHVLELGFKPRF